MNNGTTNHATNPDFEQPNDNAKSVKTVLQIAREYVANGLSIIPIKTDGSKSPSIPSWKPFQERKPTDEELQTWFGNGSNNGIAIICGSVSGNIEVPDFDDPSLIDPFVSVR